MSVPSAGSWTGIGTVETGFTPIRSEHQASRNIAVCSWSRSLVYWRYASFMIEATGWDMVRSFSASLHGQLLGKIGRICCSNPASTRASAYPLPSRENFQFCHFNMERTKQDDKLIFSMCFWPSVLVLLGQCVQGWWTVMTEICYAGVWLQQIHMCSDCYSVTWVPLVCNSTHISVWMLE